MEPLQQMKKAGALPDMEKALVEKTKVVEELTQELEDIGSAFGTEGVQQVGLYVFIIIYLYFNIFGLGKCFILQIHHY